MNKRGQYALWRTGYRTRLLSMDMGGRYSVELENRQRLTSLVGSNPTPSASSCGQHSAESWAYSAPWCCSFWLTFSGRRTGGRTSAHRDLSRYLRKRSEPFPMDFHRAGAARTIRISTLG